MLVILIIATLIGLFVFGMIWSVYLMFKPSITCPACERKFKGSGKNLTCYKCGSKLFKHANGEYAVRQ